jgi:TP901 family phage tail tape measure protein
LAVREFLVNLTAKDLTAGALESVEGAFSGLAKSFASTGLKLSAGLTAPILGAGAAVLAIGSQYDSVMDKIRTETGATGDVLVSLGDSARAVFTRIPTDLDKAGEAIALLHRQTDQSGKGLEDLAAAELELARITEGQVEPLIQTTTQMFKNWNIAVEDQVPTLDKLMRLHQETGVEINTLSSQLSQSGPILREMGFSWDESAAMIAKWTKEGVPAGMMLGGLRRATANFAEDQQKATAVQVGGVKSMAEAEGQLKKLKDQLGLAQIRQGEFTAKTKESARAASQMRINELTGQIADLEAAMAKGEFRIVKTTGAQKTLRDELTASFARIQGATSETEALAIANEVFGTRAGPMMASAVREGRLNIDSYLQTLSGSESTVMDTAAATADFSEKFTVLKNKVMDAVIPLGTSLFNAVNGLVPVFEGAVGAVTGILNRFSELSPSTQTLIFVVGGLLAALGPILGLLAPIVLVFGALLSPIGLLVIALGALGYAFATNFGGIRDAAMPILTEIQTTLTDLVRSVIENWPQIQQTILGVLGQVVTAFQTYLLPTLTQVATAIGQAISFVVQNWPQIQKTIMETASAIWSFLSPIFTQIGSFVIQVFGAIVSWVRVNWPLIRETVETVVNAIWEAIQRVLNAISAFWKQHGDTIMALVGTAWETIKTVITSALNIVLGIVKAVMQAITGDWSGAWDSIKGVAAAAWEGIKAILNLALEAIKAAIAIFGPYLVGYLKGIWEGIKKDVEEIWNAIVQFLFGASIFPEILAKAIEIWGNISTEIVNAVLGLLESLGGPFEDIQKKFWSTMEKARSLIANFSLESVGRDLIASLEAGIRQKIDDLIKSFGGWLSQIIEAGKRALGIASPSKYTEEWGRSLVEGLIKGLTRASPDISKALGRVEDMLSDLVESFRALLSFRPSAAPIEALAAIEEYAHGLITFLQNLERSFSRSLSRAADAAKGLRNIFKVLTNIVEGLTAAYALKPTLPPEGLAQALLPAIESMTILFAQFESEMHHALKQAKRGAEKLGLIFQPISTILDGLKALGAFVPVDITGKFEGMGTQIRTVAEFFGGLAGDLDVWLRDASRIAEGVGKVFGPLKTVLEGLAALFKFEAGEISVSLPDLQAQVASVVLFFSQLSAALSEQLPLASAAAEGIGKAFGPISGILSGLTALFKFEAGRFEGVLASIESQLIRVVEFFSGLASRVTALLPDAGAVAEGLGKVLSPIATVLAGLSTVYAFEVGRFTGQLGAIEAQLVRVVTFFAGLKSSLGELLADAGGVAEGLGRALSPIGQVLGGLATIYEFEAGRFTGQLGAIEAQLIRVVEFFSGLSSRLSAAFPAASAAAEQIGRAFSPITQILSGLTAIYQFELGRFEGALAGIEGQIVRVVEYFSGLAERIGDLLPAASAAAEGIGRILSPMASILSGLTAIYSFQVGQFKGVLAAIEAQIIRVVEYFSGLAERLAPSLGAAAGAGEMLGRVFSPIGAVLEGLTKLYAFTAGEFAFSLDQLGLQIEAMVDLLGNLPEAARSALEAAAATAELLSRAFSPIAEILSGLAALYEFQVGEWAGKLPAVEAAAEEVIAAFGRLVQGFEGSWELLGAVAEGMGKVFSALSEVLGGLTELFRFHGREITGVRDLLYNAMSGVIGLFSDLARDFAEVLPPAAAAAEQVEKIFGPMSTILGGLTGILEAKLRNLAQLHLMYPTLKLQIGEVIALFGQLAVELRDQIPAAVEAAQAFGRIFEPFSRIIEAFGVLARFQSVTYFGGVMEWLSAALQDTIQTLADLQGQVADIITPARETAEMLMGVFGPLQALVEAVNQLKALDVLRIREVVDQLAFLLPLPVWMLRDLGRRLEDVLPAAHGLSVQLREILENLAAGMESLQRMAERDWRRITLDSVRWLMGELGDILEGMTTADLLPVVVRMGEMLGDAFVSSFEEAVSRRRIRGEPIPGAPPGPIAIPTVPGGTPVAPVPSRPTQSFYAYGPVLIQPQGTSPEEFFRLLLGEMRGV